MCGVYVCCDSVLSRAKIALGYIYSKIYHCAGFYSVEWSVMDNT